MRARRKQAKDTGKRVRREPGRNPLVMAFATRLRAWRLDKGIHLKAIATEVGVSVSIVCEWEHARRFPSIDHLWALSQYAGIPASRLIAVAKGGCRKCQAKAVGSRRPRGTRRAR